MWNLACSGFFNLFDDMVYVRHDQNLGQGQLCNLDLDIKKIYFVHFV